MTANKTLFLVVDGAIQDGPTMVLKGQRFTPETTEIAGRLLAQGLIEPVQETLEPQEPSKPVGSSKVEQQLQAASSDEPTPEGDQPAVKPAARNRKPAAKAAADEKL